MATVSFPKRVKVEVTALDIKRGKRGDGDKCAVTRAARRVFGRRRVRTAMTFIDVESGGQGVIYDIPAKAAKFIAAFDEKQKVQPFSFVAIRKN